MTGYLNTHGTNPNLFDGTFMPLGDHWEDDDVDTGQPSSYVPIDEACPNLLEPSLLFYGEDEDDTSIYLDDEDDPEHPDTHDYWWFDSERKYPRRDELIEDSGVHKYDGQEMTDQELVEAWVKARYGDRPDFNEPFDDEDDDNVVVVHSIQPVYEDTETITAVPEHCRSPQQGCRQVTALPWWVIDDKEHKTWMGRRRGKGICRAPKWQKFAGGGRKARLTLRILSVGH